MPAFSTNASLNNEKTSLSDLPSGHREVFVVFQFLIKGNASLTARSTAQVMMTKFQSLIKGNARELFRKMLPVFEEVSIPYKG